jgi:outer membrane protein OmpA-like peptidoglycan-associated protein/tetratricopeptide (TPR) repeat protein
MPKIISLFAALVLFFTGFAQQGIMLSTQNKKAEKIFYSAADYYQTKEYDRALAELKKALELDPGFTEAYILRGDIHAEMKSLGPAADDYQSAILTGNYFSPNLYYVLANLQMNMGRYQDARANFYRFLDVPGLPEQKKMRTEQGIKNCDHAIRLMANPVTFEPENAGDSLNTPFDEYINALTADEERIYFTRKALRGDETTHNLPLEEDFFISRRMDAAWREAVELGPPINSDGNEGALSISPDGKYLFFAGCNRDDGFGSCDIYWSRREGNHWAVPVNLGPVVNSGSWDSQPSFSSDGKTLYYASKRGGGMGSSDIWKTCLMPDGSWSTPVNLGDSVNTRLEEMAPFIHPDDQTLYFSSRGWLGMGGMDLYLARKHPDGTWSHPFNLGYPINTFADEITLVVTARGDLAYISSNIPGGKGKQDIYSFRLYPEARPLLTTYFKGIVFDAETKIKLDADFELIDLETGKTVVVSTSDRQTGEFMLILPSDKNYALNVSKNGYLFYSDNFMLTGSGNEAKPFIKNVPMKPIRIGETVILKNIFFDTDKYDLKKESVAELEKLTALLQKNPMLQIELSGHTDNQGTAAYNQLLSQNRAAAVYDYLINQGISKARLTYAGYGLTRPVDTNDSDQGRANNRRTEFRVTGN